MGGMTIDTPALVSHEAAAGRSAPGEPILTVQALTKTFARRRSLTEILRGEPIRRVHALTEVDLSVRRGETLGVVGESGCGKSTLARCLVRLHRMDSGRITYDGVDVGALRGAARRGFNRRVQR
jgi:oligopeptide transport system ATP-binding protein